MEEFSVSLVGLNNEENCAEQSIRRAREYTLCKNQPSRNSMRDRKASLFTEMLAWDTSEEFHVIYESSACILVYEKDCIKE